MFLSSSCFCCFGALFFILLSLCPSQTITKVDAFLLPSTHISSSSPQGSIALKTSTITSSSSSVPRFSSTTYQEDFDIGQRIREGLLMRWPASEIERVLDSWDRMVDDNDFKDEESLRYAASYMNDLDSRPWHDVKEKQYEWLQKLEENVEIIQNELKEALENKKDLEKKGTNVWVGAARDEGAAYGPNWKTLVLQDREWDEKNTKFFPETTKLLQSLNAPTVEVFFAKQDKKTGIESHSDGCNFILTAHLGLDVPENDCWIKVGKEKRMWKNGETLIFDTHYLHETYNESKTKDRYVLLMRFWHPQVTKQEQEALSFVFKALEGPQEMTDMDFDFLESLANDQLKERGFESQEA
jgi:hypothetical protein